MTSLSKRLARQQAKVELDIFNRLPKALRDAINDCEGQPPKASIVLATLLRGVSEQTIIETIKRSQNNAS